MFRYISPVFAPATVAAVPVTAVPVCHVTVAPVSPFYPFKLLNVKVVVVPLVFAVTLGVPTAPILPPAAAFMVGVVPLFPGVPCGPLILQR